MDNITQGLNEIKVRGGRFYNTIWEGGVFDNDMIFSFVNMASYPQPNEPVGVAYSAPKRLYAGPPINRLVTSNSSTTAINWAAYKQGDILILRDTDTNLAAKTIGGTMALFSIMTHAGMYYDNFKNYESWGGGVDLYDRNFSPASAWNQAPVVVIKRLNYKRYPSVNPAMAVNNSLNNYRYRPFFPPFVWDPVSFTTVWSDKNDITSFYCSKLAWKTYFDAGVDLDSNFTKASTLYNFTTGKNYWIGVSPDDLLWAAPTYIVWAKGNLNNAPIYYSGVPN